ncbi:MAG: hypothetical protein ACYTFN_14780 [Planctomycetota bacterium]|jgi:hypothetical protein
MNKSLRKRITLANKYIRFAKREGIWGTGYFGSTWPAQIEYTKEISVSPAGNIVTVQYTDLGSAHPYFKERYDVRKPEHVSDLRHEISTFIIKAIKNGAKEDGVAVPAFKA